MRVGLRDPRDGSTGLAIVTEDREKIPELGAPDWKDAHRKRRPGRRRIDDDLREQ